MQDTSRQGNRLIKRRPVASPTRARRSSANHLSEDTPAVPPLNDDYEYNVSVEAMPSNTASSDKEKRSKWRLSNPFHSKDKERHDGAELMKDSTKDSAYGSNETSSRSDINSSGIPSFSSTDRRGSHPNRPVSGEQSRPEPPRPEPTTVQATPTTNVIPPTPPTHGSNPLHTQESNPTHPSNVPRPHEADVPNTHENNPLHAHENSAPSTQTTHGLANQKSVENISKETHEDARTGHIVTTVTTTTTTTTTTTGPGGSTTVQVPTAQQDSSPPEANITSTSGPSPPSPAPPLSQQPSLQQGLTHPHEPFHGNPSPPIPSKSNTRNRVELDSVSPGVERPNPMVSPVTPTSPTRTNFSYPARTPPPGVPRQVPVPHFSGDRSEGYSQQQQQEYQQSQQPQQPQQPSYGERYDAHPAPLRTGHLPQQPHQPQVAQKQSTLTNLKTAAAGLHGAGEALRGTLNNTVDKRFTNPNSAVHARNQAAIDTGRREVETGRLSHHQHKQQQQQQIPPIPTQYPSTLQHNPNAKTAYSGPPVSGSQIEGNSGSSNGGRIGSFMKKLKDGPMAAEKVPDGRLRVVNE